MVSNLSYTIVLYPRLVYATFSISRVSICPPLACSPHSNKANLSHPSLSSLDLFLFPAQKNKRQNQNKSPALCRTARRTKPCTHAKAAPIHIGGETRRVQSRSFSSMEKRKKCGGLFGRCRSSGDFLRWAGKTVKRGVAVVVGWDGMGREGKEWCRERLSRPGGIEYYNMRAWSFAKGFFAEGCLGLGLYRTWSRGTVICFSA